MKYDVFISCTPEDKEHADAICHYLESSDIKCWYAFRDIPKAVNSSEIIPTIITDSRIMIYVLSESSSENSDILSQINTAVSNGIDIITFRVSDIHASEKFQYYIAGSHWLDALTPPLEEKLEQLKLWVEDKLNSSDSYKKRKKINRYKYSRHIKIALCFIFLAAISFVLFNLYQSNSKSIVRNLFANNNFIDNYFVSLDCRMCAEPHQDGTVDILDLVEGKIIQTLKTEFENKKLNIIFCNDNKYAFISYKADYVLFDLQTGREISRFSLYPDNNDLKLVAYGEYDNSIDFFIGNKYLYLTDYIVRYDFQGNKVIMKANVDDCYIYNYTKDYKYIIADDTSWNLILLDNTSLEKAEISDKDALALCNQNLLPDTRNFSPDGLYYLETNGLYLTETDFQLTTNVSILRCEDSKEIFSANYANMNDIWFYDNTSFVVVSKYSTERVNFLANERTPIFNEKILKNNKAIANKSIVGIRNCEGTNYIFTLLYDKEQNKEKMYVIDLANNKVILSFDPPVRADSYFLYSYDNRIVFCYLSNGMYSIDYTTFSVDKSGKIHFTAQKLR